MFFGRLSIGLFIIKSGLEVSAQICYTPNGSVSNDRPCSNDGSESVCCTQGFLCTSNGLCQPRHWHDGVEPLKFIRGTCTDKTWKSPKCQGHCVQENPSGGEWVMRCGQNATKYCCSAEDCCMRNDYIKIELDRPTVTATAGIFLSASTSLTIAPSSSEISPSSSFQTPTSSPSVFPTPISDPSKDRRSLGLRVGVGVGVAIGVLLVLGALALWKFFQNRRKRKDEPEEVIEHGPSGETSDQYRNAGGIIQELPSKQQRSELE